ncbi:sel1 repeat family protein [Ponticoccus sp. SC2-23]|uniref:tetratricopeptide repeat protein n=1 Tax=Alexandriicola marinus TaxID=2081710 RepID=UPI000FD8B072|nr:tetratricopeptide repeat protein [Alexandriicola marinus]MBM1218819.1 sel1 repeat family protein [Ponticoccus sp. SC6-9]MBM1224109.1 sel1 repeat family protein [Ponticoccus sp. SC6-15]MBM1230112.1 sel1 repeat family protein [Ponticoccus sp. SC6-38]MBM1233075.1 sel1 repeat family protein [Ponticoccus sp. SC6-45]MBM1236975.1 sel1 repeat family protein [Ponticoccus sp. SC6-49]MBM1242086.1 sel1 repeat family protein [Ponticoccus sp. SC2-64]MBM1246599.1 sel1 repeat family protein [Ponticoccus 
MTCKIFALIAAVLLALPAAAQDHDEMTRARDLLIGGAHAEAISLLRPSAEAGHPRAQNLLGAAYEHGLGVAQSGAEALRLYTASADQGYPPALFNLGLIFARGGPGIAPDRARAIEMFDRATALDYSAAFGAYAGYLLETARSQADRDRALTLALRGLDLGDPASIEIMAFLRRTGQAGPQDPTAARRLYEIAALLGSTSAQMQVAGMFAQGEGGPPDYRQAHEYYTFAIEAGRAEALHARGRVVMNWPDQFENGRVIGLAECLAGADLLRRNDWFAICKTQAESYPQDLYAAALAEVPAIVEAFSAMQQ